MQSTIADMEKKIHRMNLTGEASVNSEAEQWELISSDADTDAS